MYIAMTLSVSDFDINLKLAWLKPLLKITLEVEMPTLSV